MNIHWMGYRNGFVAGLIGLLSGCASTVNTLPPVASADDPTQETVLWVPDGLDIQSVDFDATLYSDVSGGGLGAATGTSVGGRAFVKVYAVDRQSGEQVLLLYENIAERRRPIQVIRFQVEN